MNEINDDMFREKSESKDSDDTNDSSNDWGTGTPEETEASTQEETQPGQTKNKGTLTLDAVCAPADIAYPTDINLLNEAREKLEKMIDGLHPRGDNVEKS